MRGWSEATAKVLHRLQILLTTFHSPFSLSNFDVSNFVSQYVASRSKTNLSPSLADSSYLSLVSTLNAAVSGPSNFLPPEYVYPWLLKSGNSTDVVITKGLVLGYSFDYMKKSTLMTESYTSDGTVVVRDYSKISDMVEGLGRRLEALTVHWWYPNQFAEEQENVIQEVRPIRSGLQNLKSTGAVWRRENLGEEGGE